MPSQLLTAEEIGGVGLLECAQALVRVATLERARSRSNHAERPLERQVLRGVLVLQPRLDDLDGLRQTLDADGPALRVRDALDLACEVRHLARHENLARIRHAAEPSGEVESAAAEPVVDRDSLARVEADPDREGKARV